MAKNDCLLNHIFLKNRVTELGIKQWWLAEQVGVDRKTVIRWMQGQVKSIQLENAQALAKILNCDVADLSLENEADKFATVEDQKAAASALIASSLVDKLGPIGEWDVIESLVKATVVANLPLNILGELYDKLTIASWRQSKIDQASLYNLKTEEIARKTDDRVLLASALISKANIYSWRGDTESSIATYKQCLEFEKYISAKALGSVYSNLGAVLCESGNLTDGEYYVQKSLEVFNEDEQALNISVAHCHLAIIYLQSDKIEEAEIATDKSVRYAELADYRRGKAQGKLLKAEVAAYRKNKPEALRLVQEGLADFASLHILEGLNFEQAGRCYRLLGDSAQAEVYFRKGIALSNEFPVYQAALYFELAQTLQGSAPSDCKAAAQKALELYQKCHCHLRVDAIKKFFKIK